MILTIANKSLMNRKGSALLTMLAMAVSLFVLLAVEHIRNNTKQSFASTISGVDLIVGSRTSSINLLLYSVFRIGSPTSNLSWSSYEKIRLQEHIAWSIPISLGDSHKGYRVMGTDDNFFKHYKYGKKHSLEFETGSAFKTTLELVIGSEIAKRLHYKRGDSIILAHGIGTTSFSQHDQHPFTITGILKPTGTPVDQTLYVSLQGIEAMHSSSSNRVDHNIIKPKSITAFMLGLTSRLSTFSVQNKINRNPTEPLTAILPGVALSELWQIMGSIENLLDLIAYLVLLASLLGLSAMLLTSIRERQQEIQLLRIIGAPPIYIFLIIEMEAVVIALISSLISLLSLWSILLIFQSSLLSEFGLQSSASLISMNTLQIIAAVLIATIIAAGIPSIMAYRSAKLLNKIS